MLHWRHEKLIYVKFSGRVICLRHIITLAHMYGTQKNTRSHDNKKMESVVGNTQRDYRFFHCIVLFNLQRNDANMLQSSHGSWLYTVSSWMKLVIQDQQQCQTGLGGCVSTKLYLKAGETLRHERSKFGLLAWPTKISSDVIFIYL